MSTIVGTNIEVTNLKFDSDTTSMIISNTGQVTIQGEGSATTNLQQGLAKMWVHAHQDAAQDSLNVASSTDVGTGNYRFTFTNNFTSNQTCPSGSNQSTRNGRGLYMEPTSASVRMNSGNSAGTSTDYNTTISVVGDLA